MTGCDRPERMNAMRSLARTVLVLLMASAFALLACCDKSGQAEGPEKDSGGPAVEKQASGPGVSPPVERETATIDPSLPPIPVRPGMDEKAEFTVIYTTGVTGEIVDCGCPHHPRGGLARRAKYVEGIDKARDVIQVDGGAVFFPYKGTRRQMNDLMKDKARVLARGMSMIGVDAVNVGAYDLAAGLDFLTGELANPEGQDPVPFISANLVKADSGDRIFPPYRIVVVDGAQVGIFGVTAEDAATGQEGLKVLPPLETSQEMMEALKPKCDMIIGLFAMPFAEASRLVGQLKGLDMAVPSDRTASPRTRPLALAETIVVQAGNRGMYLGRIDVVLEPGAKSGISQEQRSKMQSDLARLEAQVAILEGPVSQDPELRRKYQEVVTEERRLRDRLSSLASRFDHEHSLVSMDLDLPEDETVAAWITEIGVEPKTKK